MDIQMPQLGETVTEGTITRWLKSVGDHVDADEPLFEVSTDKVDSEVPAPAAGTLSEILVQEGETAEVGTRLAVISDGAGGAGAPAAAATTSAAPPQSAPPPQPAPRPRAGSRRVRHRHVSRPAPRPPRSVRPLAVRALAADPATPAGAGLGAHGDHLGVPGAAAHVHRRSAHVAGRAPAAQRVRPRRGRGAGERRRRPHHPQRRPRSRRPAGALGAGGGLASRPDRAFTHRVAAAPGDRTARRRDAAPVAPAPAPAAPRKPPRRRRPPPATRPFPSTTSGGARPSTWSARRRRARTSTRRSRSTTSASTAPGAASRRTGGSARGSRSRTSRSSCAPSATRSRSTRTSTPASTATT